MLKQWQGKEWCINGIECFFSSHRVLDISEGITEVGHVRWELVGLLLLCWVIEYLCIFKGVRLTGKVRSYTHSHTQWHVGLQ